MPEANEPISEHHAPQLTDDEKHLARLGYSQDLNRSWSGFSNFAISFSIISILAGCFTNFGAGFNNGGPISISWSWPILGLFILLIGFTMSELVSAYPTSGGIYWWASKLGGPAAGFFTGWLNLIGLVAVTAGTREVPPQPALSGTAVVRTSAHVPDRSCPRLLRHPKW